jgi:DNA-binding protein H-NS
MTSSAAAATACDPMRPTVRQKPRAQHVERGHNDRSRRSVWLGSDASRFSSAGSLRDLNDPYKIRHIADIAEHRTAGLEMQLKSMSLPSLVGLREKVEAALQARIGGARSELESRLKELSDFGGAQSTVRRGPRGRVPPKYRNPDNPSETWTGRGRAPRWLAAELKRGSRLEDFLIEGGPKRRRKAVAKVRKAKAARKAKTTRKAKATRKQAKPRKVRTAARPRKAAKPRRAGEPLKAGIARRPPAASLAPSPTLAEQSGAQTPTA